MDWEADRAGGVEEARVICKEGVGANSERSGEEAGRAITFVEPKQARELEAICIAWVKIGGARGAWDHGFKLLVG